MSPRDSQRSKVYTAENQTMASYPAAGMDDPGFVRTIAGSRWFKAQAKLTATPEIVFDRRSTFCNANLNRSHGCLLVPDTCTRHLQIVHALAHLVTPRNEERAWHSPAFCLTYVEMTKRFIDGEAGAALREAFKVNKVKLRSVSPEARAAASDRWYARKEANLENDLQALLDHLEDN